MAKKERSSNDVYELVGEFFGYVKTQFEKNERKWEITNKRIELINDDIRDIKHGQREIEKDVQGLKEDMTSVIGAIAELANDKESKEE